MDTAIAVGLWWIVLYGFAGMASWKIAEWAEKDEK